MQFNSDKSIISNSNSKQIFFPFQNDPCFIRKLFLKDQYLIMTNCKFQIH